MPFKRELEGNAHSLNRRQTVNQDRCSEALLEYQCTTGYGEELVSIATQCGNNDLARSFAEGCARNENNQYCRTAVRNAPGIPSSCTMVNESCPTSCSSYLRTIRSSLGCCINSLLNTTDSSSELRELFSNSLWSCCGVETVLGSCNNGLNFRPIFNSKVCTDDDFHQRLATAECTSPYSEGIKNAFTREGVCQDELLFKQDSCKVNSDGERCGAEARDDLVALSETGTAAVLSVLVTCDSATTRFCPSSCRNALQTFEKDLGCCANALYNNPNSPDRMLFTSALWNACDVDDPGLCNSNTVVIATSVTGSVAFAILAAASLISVIVYCSTDKC